MNEKCYTNEMYIITTFMFKELQIPHSILMSGLPSVPWYKAPGHRYNVEKNDNNNI